MEFGQNLSIFVIDTLYRLSMISPILTLYRLSIVIISSIHYTKTILISYKICYKWTLYFRFPGVTMATTLYTY
jgi:hypothetical protein